MFKTYIVSVLAMATQAISMESDLVLALEAEKGGYGGYGGHHGGYGKGADYGHVGGFGKAAGGNQYGHRGGAFANDAYGANAGHAGFDQAAAADRYGGHAAGGNRYGAGFDRGHQRAAAARGHDYGDAGRAFS